MVVKTETCFYSELRIYPGHGSRVVRRDGKLLIFIDSKSKCHYQNRKKAQNLRWSQAWRRANKKVRVDKELTKKFVKKTAKVFKAFVGLSLDDLKARQDANSDVRKANRESADRAKTLKSEKKNKSEKGEVKAKVPKFVAARIKNIRN